jgi:DNA-directed RNA polymerase specialized sigma24 family protein
MSSIVDRSTGSITDWLRSPEKREDPDSFRILWQNFGIRLVRLARFHLRGKRDPAYGSDDLALSVFHQACKRLEQGYLEKISCSNDLWKLLVKISKQKSINHYRSLKNRETKMALMPVESLPSMVDLRTDRIKTVVDNVELIAEETSGLLQLLRDHDPTQELSQIALMLLEGRSKSRIARDLGRTRRTIDVRLDLIKSIWSYYLQLHKD